MKGNQIKKIPVKVKENPLQFFTILGCFVLLAFLICVGAVYQSNRAKHLSKEQATVLLEESGAFRADMEAEIQTLSEQLSEKDGSVAENERLLQELTKEYEDLLDTYSMQQISATSESLQSVKESIKNSELILVKIREGMQSNSKDTIALITEQMTDLAGRLKELDERYAQSTNGIKNLIEHLGQENSEASKDMVSKLKDVESNLVNTGKTQIAESAKEMQKTFESKTEEMTDKLSDQYNTLSSEMGNKYDTLNSNIEDQYDALNSSIGDRYDALSSDLGSQYDSLSSDLGSQYDSLSSDLGGRYDSLSSDLGNKYDTLNSSLSENYSYLQSQFADFQKMLVAVGDRNQSIQSYLEQRFGAVDGKLSQVFQSVSSGKNILASALLTKGVEIPQDASFNQIKEGILSIPQTIYLGTETKYIPGKISYDYHRHVDGGGNQTGNEANKSQKGGCFTTPVYHVHTNDCYETYFYTEYTVEHVDWYWTNDHTHGNSYTGVPDSCRTCSFCGAHEIYGGHEDHMAKVERTQSGLRLKCGKTEGETVEAYTYGCGLSEGQIIGAHIVY